MCADSVFLFLTNKSRKNGYTILNTTEMPKKPAYLRSLPFPKIIDSHCQYRL